MPVGLSPTWWVKKREIQSLPTCDHIWNGKAVFFNNFHETKTWTDEPAFEPFTEDRSQDGNLVDDNQNPYPFVIMPVPGVIRRAVLHIHSNSMTVPFEIWLGRDGPTDVSRSNVPVEVKRLFRIPEKTDPSYPNSGTFKFPGGDSGTSTILPLFGGHSYGWIFKTPTGILPSGSIQISLSVAITFGGGGS